MAQKHSTSLQCHFLWKINRSYTAHHILWFEKPRQTYTKEACNCETIREELHAPLMNPNSPIRSVFYDRMSRPHAFVDVREWQD
jgi:hypothetical protein